MPEVINDRLDWNDIKKSAAQFAIRYKKAEKEESFKQAFWVDFFKIFGVDAIQVGIFEYYVKKFGENAGEIDYFWPGKVLIEHKSAGKNLEKALDQAIDYYMGLENKKEWPRYIIVSDFKRIRLLDVVEHNDDTVLLEELADNIELFGFLAGYDNKRIEGQHPVNIKAAEVMGQLELIFSIGHSAGPIISMPRGAPSLKILTASRAVSAASDLLKLLNTRRSRRLNGGNSSISRSASSLP